MRKILASALIDILIVIVLMQTSNVLAATDSRPFQPNEIKISGLVNKPLNFTFAELLTFPMISELAVLKCVDRTWKITLNWTGIPLFHLLTLAQVKPKAQGVTFQATDGFLSTITIKEALKPTTILALRANGTLLSEITGREGGFRIVVPCKWGYKWVTDVREIEVVDYYNTGKGEEMPNCEQPSVTPPLQVIAVPIGNRQFQVEAFTNVSIEAANFNYSQKEISFNLTVPSKTLGFADLIIQQPMLKGPYSVFLNEEAVNAVEANVGNITFLYLTFTEGLHTLKIVGTDAFGIVPQIVVEFNQTTYIGETVIFNATKSIDDGKIVSYEWNFGDGTNGNGTITSHSYAKEGTYLVTLKATDNDGLSNSTTLTVNVHKEVTHIHFIIGTVSAITIGALALILIILLLKRETKMIIDRL